MQKASIYIFGVTTLSIKLPSIILGVASGLGLIILLKRWFKNNVAIIGGLLGITSSLYLTSGRTGTAAILLIFWSTYLLLLGTLITQQAKGQFLWRISLGAVLGLSLFTPLSIYVIVSIIIAGLLHPHARYVLRRYGSVEATCAILFFLIAVVPLGFGIWKQPTLALELMGIPELFPTSAIYANQALGVARFLGDFTAPGISDFIQPAFNMATILLIILGTLRALIDYHATRTYALLIWAAVLIPVVTLQPDYVNVLFVPAILLLAIGIQTLIREWYTIFPRNPYARVAGLIPLVALIAGASYLNYTRYFEGYRYSPSTARVYDNDLDLLNSTLASDKINKQKIIITIDAEDSAFYDLLRKKNPDLLITSDKPAKLTQKGTIIASSKVMPAAETPSSLVVNDNSENSLRWRIYTKW
jgi:4-amino-4-deoxy-L-arabinose transferase-like glycosyltransferase